MSQPLPKKTTRIHVSPFNRERLEQIKQDWEEMNERPLTMDEVISRLIERGYEQVIFP
jgi:hypothetical protein